MVRGEAIEPELRLVEWCGTHNAGTSSVWRIEHGSGIPHPRGSDREKVGYTHHRLHKESRNLSTQIIVNVK